MAHSFIAKTVSGIIVVADEECRSAAWATDAESMASLSEKKGFFVIDTEDEAELRIELSTEEDSPSAMLDSYESIGGTFRLALPTGSLYVWDPAGSDDIHKQAIPSGTYALSARRLNTHDLSNFVEHMKTALGEDRWRYREWIGNIELIGCGAILLAVLSVIIPFTRPYWWICIPALLFPYLLASLFKCTPRYRKIEQDRVQFEREQAHLILTLAFENHLPESVHGGTIQFYD